MFTKNKTLIYHCIVLFYLPQWHWRLIFFHHRTQKGLSSKISRLFYIMKVDWDKRLSKSSKKSTIKSIWFYSLNVFLDNPCAIIHNSLLCYGSRPLGGCSRTVWRVVCRRRTGFWIWSVYYKRSLGSIMSMGHSN